MAATSPHAILCIEMMVKQFANMMIVNNNNEVISITRQAKSGNFLSLAVQIN